jgi:lipopolysaccharide export LptBFGC system permease protein LptF
MKPVYSKVKASGLAGIIVTVIVWALGSFLGIEVPPEVAAALVTVITFIVGFFKSELVGR